MYKRVGKNGDRTVDATAENIDELPGKFTAQYLAEN